MKKFFHEGNQIHNFISSSTSQKVTVPTVPVPVPQRWSVQWITDGDKKKVFFTFFCLFLTVDTWTCHWESQNGRSHGFSFFLLVDWRIRIRKNDYGSGSVHMITDPDPRGPKTCGSAGTLVYMKLFSNILIYTLLLTHRKLCVELLFVEMDVG